MPIGADTLATRRHLPHFAKRDRPLFVTFTTRNRFVLPDVARKIALDTCVADHEVTYWLNTAVVMPDHVHLLLTPFDAWPLARIMRRIKGVSARRINDALGRNGTVWQSESFDRVLRHDESVTRAGEYIAANPVRKGLVSRPEDYPWLWQAWVQTS